MELELSIHNVHWGISHPSFRQFHLLKVTKFLVKISQFKFLVMTEKNIFVYKHLSLNISDFSLVMSKLEPHEKGHPLFPSNAL